MCAWEGFWRAGGDDTAVCYKYIHRPQSQEGGLQQSNLTSFIRFFCTCVKYLERKHLISTEGVISLAMLFRSSQYQGPNFSWDNKTFMRWRRREVLGCWFIKKCAHHQWLDSSPGPYICPWTLWSVQLKGFPSSFLTFYFNFFQHSCSRLLAFYLLSHFLSPCELTIQSLFLHSYFQLSAVNLFPLCLFFHSPPSLGHVYQRRKKIIFYICVSLIHFE